MAGSPTTCEIIKAFAFRATTIYMGICGPEFILGWAFTEWKLAGKLRDEANEALWPASPGTEKASLWTRICRFCANMLKVRGRFWKIPRAEKTPRWTRTHGFCAIMRGLSVQHGYGDEAVERLWTEADLKTLDALLEMEMKHLSKDKIMDKSKADWAVKGLACLQISWFAIQQGARLQQGLPISLLELATNAYVLCTLLAYFFYFW